MEEFLVLMRLDLLTKESQPSPEQMQVYMKQYQEWVSRIVEKNKFIGGKGLSTEGRVLKYNQMITDGPFVEIKESLAGYIMIYAQDFDDAISMARDCPILHADGNSLEIRKVVSVHTQ